VSKQSVVHLVACGSQTQKRRIPAASFTFGAIPLPSSQNSANETVCAELPECALLLQDTFSPSRSPWPGHRPDEALARRISAKFKVLRLRLCHRWQPLPCLRLRLRLMRCPSRTWGRVHAFALELEAAPFPPGWLVDVHPVKTLATSVHIALRIATHIHAHRVHSNSSRPYFFIEPLTLALIRDAVERDGCWRASPAGRPADAPHPHRVRAYTHPIVPR